MQTNACCYTQHFKGATRERTKVRKNADNPVWNEIHYFYVPPANAENEVKSFQVDVYDWNRIEKSTFIGSTSLVLEELVAGPVQDLQVNPILDKYINIKVNMGVAM